MIYIRVYEAFSIRTADRVSAYFLFLIVGNTHINKTPLTTNKNNTSIMNFRKWSKRYSDDCDFKYQSLSTRKTYKNGVHKFLEHFKGQTEPKAIPTTKIKAYILEANTFNTRKHRQCSINSFYKLTVKMPLKISSLPYPSAPKPLPRIIDTQHLQQLINSITNLKHKALLMLTYSCALRRSEVLHLKITDIDSKRMIIYVRNAKGNKDRIVKLSNHLLTTLRLYFKSFKPKVYLFNGQTSLQYSAASCNKLVKTYIGKEYSMHHLRHSGATAMLENGTEINIIQKVLGHNSINTTMIYTHVSNNLIQRVQAPM